MYTNIQCTCTSKLSNVPWLHVHTLDDVHMCIEHLHSPYELSVRQSVYFTALLQVIDENHPISSCKYLRNKPVRELKGDEFLRLTQAETDGLIILKIGIDVESQTNKR